MVYFAVLRDKSVIYTTLYFTLITMQMDKLLVVRVSAGPSVIPVYRRFTPLLPTFTQQWGLGSTQLRPFMVLTSSAYLSSVIKSSTGRETKGGCEEVFVGRQSIDMAYPR